MKDGLEVGGLEVVEGVLGVAGLAAAAEVLTGVVEGCLVGPAVGRVDGPAVPVVGLMETRNKHRLWFEV